MAVTSLATNIPWGDQELHCKHAVIEGRMQMAKMRKISMTDLRLNLRDLVDDVYFNNDEVVVQRSGRAMLVLLSPRAYRAYRQVLAECSSRHDGSSRGK
jgi:hypothetical protein